MFLVLYEQSDVWTSMEQVVKSVEYKVLSVLQDYSESSREPLFYLFSMTTPIISALHSGFPLHLPTRRP